MRRLLTSVSVVLLLVLGACSQEEPPASSPSVPSGAASCPTDQSPLSVVPEGSTTAADVSGLVVCRTSDGRRAYVQNVSERVWVIDSPAGLRWLEPPRTPQATIFRRLVAGLTPMDLPSTGLAVEPGTAAQFVLSPASRIHLVLDARLQAMWHGQQAVTEKVVSAGQDRAIALMSRDSPSRRAVLACGLAAYRIGSTLTGGEADVDLETGLGVGGDAKDCGKAVRVAQADAQARRVTPVVSVTDSIRVTRSPAWRTSTRLNVWLARAGRVAVSMFHP